MTELFLKVLDLSLSASWVILAVLAARLVLKKAPKWVLCALWALVAVRLLCPFSLESSLSLVPEVPFSSDAISTQTLTSEETSPAAAPNAQAPSQGESREMEGRAYGEILSSEGEVLVTKELKDSKAASDWYHICAVLWAAGMVILLFYATVSYRRIREKVRVSVDIGNGVFICDYIDTPFILGIMKPRVYLPSAMDPADAAHVLAHERAHLKRRDHWWKPLGFLLLSVHWFTPLVWAAYILLCRDIELACDERVVKTMDLPEKKAYSEALLNCSVPRRMIAACPLAFGEVGVKQRVKNVLNYKKPAFWVLLISLLVMAIVAVCFLTDPKVPVLSDFYTGSRSDVTCIDLMNNKGHACLDMPTDMDAVWDFLDELEYDPQPHDSEEEWDNLNDQGFGYCELEFNIGKQTQTLYFYRDFSSVCCEDEQGVLNHYTVKNPELAETFFSTYISCIRRTEVSVEPFATWEEPYAWMQNATTEAFLGARVNRSELGGDIISSTSYAMSLVRLEEFLAVLKTVPASALSGPETIGEGGTDHITVIHRNDPNLVISIQDGANDLGVAIRYYQEAGTEKLEIVMVEGAENFASNYHSYIRPVLKWDIQCQELLDYMKGLLDYNLGVSMFSGYWMDWADDYITVTNGEAQIKQRRLNDWTYEIVEPTEGCESFGIRVRPPEEEEGWLYFSWWGDNFVPGEETWQEGISLFGTHFSYYQSYPEDTQNTGILSYTRMHCIHGDYVILNEGADAWLETYSLDLNYVGWATSFECLPQLTQTEISDAVAYTLEDMLYYDWDAIARWFGNGPLTLFDPQFYDGFLFVGCEENGNYHILVFRQQKDGSYEYLQALSPTEQTISNYDTATLPMVQYQTADSEVQLCLITDPAITGLECGSGLQNYIPITSYPALVLLDRSCWDNQSGVYFELRYDALPPSVAINLYNNGNRLVLEEQTYEQQYIYSNVVSYFDGTNKPGRYALDSEEIQELIDILTSLPQEAIARKYLATEEQDLQVDLTLFADSGQRFAWGDTRLEFVYSDDAVTLCVSTSTETKSYSENHQYYYTIESEELRDFLLALCDASRGTADLLAASTADPIEYRHGDAAIKLYPMLGLEYEIVEYTDDETPFGIRVRPLSSNKGWVFYSYWPNGFSAEENQEDYTFSEGAHMGTDELGSWRYEYRTAYQKGKDCWSYEQITNVDGDYVILNENADNWLSEWSSYLTQQVRRDSFADGVTLDATPSADDGTLTVANGSGSIQFQTKPGWECEIVEYTDDETPFGIRIRPVIYDEGWLFISYWPNGFTSEETIQSFSVTSMLAVHNGKLLDASFCAAYTAEEMARDKQYRVWTYAQLAGLPASGDYVLLNEGAERWFKDYEQYIFPSISWDSETNGITVAMID